MTVRDGSALIIQKSTKSLDHLRLCDCVVVHILTTDLALLGVQLGNGDGTFRTPILQSPDTSGGDGDVALGDFNNDGRLDAAVGGQAALPDGLTVLTGNGDGTFGVPFQSPQRCSTGGNDS